MPARIDELLIEADAEACRAVAVVEGRVVDAQIESRRDDGGRAGAIHLGRVTRVAPGLGAAFVDIGLQRAAILDLGGTPLREGERVIVQIVEVARDEEGGEGKGPRVTRAIGLAGNDLVLRPLGGGLHVSRRLTAPKARQRVIDTLKPLLAAGEGVIARSGSETQSAENMQAELAFLRARWAAILARAKVATPPARLDEPSDPLRRILDAFAPADPQRIVCEGDDLARAMRDVARSAHPGLVARIEAARDVLDRHDAAGVLAASEEEIVRLPSGGRIRFRDSHIATTIDVDTAAGHASSQKGLRVGTNLEAAAEIGRQLRLRDLQGPIVIDFLRLNHPRARADLKAAVEQAVVGDRRPVQVLGYTRIGFFELIRSRGSGPVTLD
jgi:Rne/Rng family ribonuclease